MTSLRNSPQIEFENTEDLQPFANHSKIHSEKKMESLKNSLSHSGMKNPVLIDKSKVIIDGHARWQAWRALGHQQIPTICVDDGSELDNRLLRIRLAELSRQSKTDLLTLTRELTLLHKDRANLALTGIAPHILAKRIAIPSLTTEGRRGKIHSAPAATVAGDHWRCGKSHLICKIFSSASVTDLQLKEKSVPLIICRADTTAPHNAAKDAVSTLAEQMAQADAFLKPGAHALISIDIAHLPDLLRHTSAFQLVDLCSYLTTDASDAVLHFRDMAPLFVLRRKDDEPGEVSLRDGARQHLKRMRLPTNFTKTTALLLHAISHYSQRGDTILDISPGAGASLLAAERTGRTCIGFDGSADSVDASIRHWQRMVGRDAVHSISRKTFNEKTHVATTIEDGVTDV